MIDKKYIIFAILAIVIVAVSEGTKFEMTGFIGAFVLLGTMSLLQIYKYNELKHTFSNISFQLKRDNFGGPLINCYIVGKFIRFKDITNIVEDETLLLKNKRLTVAYKPDDSIGFKLNKRDYEKIKNHIKFYSGLVIINTKTNISA